MLTLFLDFDGVLYDTLKEAYVLCRHVCFGIYVFAPIEKDIYEKFYKYKFLVFNSWQYLYLMKSLDSDDVEKTYKHFLNNRDIEAEEVFEEKYLETRQWLIKNHSDYVDSLEEKFPFLDMIKSVSDKVDVLIISRKNTFAIKRKNTGFKIVGKEELAGVVNKSEYMECYMKEHSVERAFFVDDNSHNLLPCSTIPNLTCILAGWGNIAIGETGYTQEDAFSLIVKHI